jgi:hypothetical protein
VPSPVKPERKDSYFFLIFCFVFVLFSFLLTPSLLGDPSTLQKIPTLIGKPYNVQHNVHVQVGKYGFKGLPVKWQQILLASGVPEEVVKNNPDTVEKLMHNIRMPDSLQHQQEPSSSTTTSSSSISNHTVEELDEQEQDQELPMGYAPPSRARSSKLLHISLFKSTATDIPPLPNNQDTTTTTTTTNTNTNTNTNTEDSHLALSSNFIGKFKQVLHDNSQY